VLPEMNFCYSLANYYRSSGAFQDWKRSSASVLPISLRARCSRSIVCTCRSSGKSSNLCSASAKNSSSRFDVAHIPMISSSSSLLSLRAFAARLSASSRRHCSYCAAQRWRSSSAWRSLSSTNRAISTVAFSNSRTIAGTRVERSRFFISRHCWDHWARG